MNLILGLGQVQEMRILELCGSQIRINHGHEIYNIATINLRYPHQVVSSTRQVLGGRPIKPRVEFSLTRQLARYPWEKDGGVIEVYPSTCYYST